MMRCFFPLVAEARLACAMTGSASLREQAAALYGRCVHLDMTALSMKEER